MTIVRCPFCYSQNTVPIVTSDTRVAKCYKSIKEKLKDEEVVLSNSNAHYSLNYDGEVIKRNTYDRFCTKCKKPFYYFSNLIVSDIKVLTFIIETGNDKWKYEIHFDKNNPYYNIDHNYITKSNKASLTPARKFKILDGINQSDFLKWSPSKEKNYFDYKIKWNVYVDFVGGHTYNRGGCDEYPEQWHIFIDPFIKVFKQDIFKKMK